MQLPKARTSELLEMEAGSELLIYDLRVNKAYQLNVTLKNVFKACDEPTSFDDLKCRHGLTDDIIYLGLDELRKNDLLEGEYVSPFAGLSRREVVRKVGLASMIALPVIAGIVAPTAASAASNSGRERGQLCNTPPDCQSGNCVVTSVFPGFPPTTFGGFPGYPPFTVPGSPPQVIMNCA